MYDGKVAASNLLKRTTAELKLIATIMCREDHFNIDNNIFYFHPKNREQAEKVFEVYNQLRTSPLIKALE